MRYIKDRNTSGMFYDFPVGMGIDLRLDETVSCMIQHSVS